MRHDQGQPGGWEPLLDYKDDDSSLIFRVLIQALSTKELILVRKKKLSEGEELEIETLLDENVVVGSYTFVRKELEPRYSLGNGYDDITFLQCNSMLST